jgi:hypothetical protein
MITTDLKPGDIITAYEKGTHEVIRIERRFYTKELIDGFPTAFGDKAVGDEYNPMIVYRRRLNSKGKVLKSKKEISCDSSYCHKVTLDTIAKEYYRVVDQAEKLKKAMEELL